MGTTLVWEWSPTCIKYIFQKSKREGGKLKMEGGKVTYWGEDLFTLFFFFFFFCCTLFKWADPGMGRFGPSPSFWQLNHANSACFEAISANFNPNFDTQPPLFANPGSGPVLKPLKFVLGLPKCEFSTGKKHFTDPFQTMSTSKLMEPVIKGYQPSKKDKWWKLYKAHLNSLTLTY